MAEALSEDGVSGKRSRWEENLIRKGLIHAALREPFLTASLRLALFGLLAHAWFFVETAPLEFPEKTFAGKFFLGNLESFFDVIVEYFDFHRPSQTA